MTTKTTHTTGPWQVGENGIIWGRTLHDAEGGDDGSVDAREKIATVHVPSGVVCRLIAAAPELLSVAKKMLDARHLVCAHFDELRAAIDKAEGRNV